jgi:hypothetical protein
MRLFSVTFENSMSLFSFAWVQITNNQPKKCNNWKVFLIATIVKHIIDALLSQLFQKHIANFFHKEQKLNEYLTFKVLDISFA